jgi:two-component system response regulator HydG
LSKLKSHYWRGNVRELKSIIKRASLLASGKDIKPSDIDMAFSQEIGYDRDGHSLPEIHQDFSLNEYLNEQEKLIISRALQLADNNKSKAAKILQLKSPSALEKKLKKHGIEVKKKA